MPTGSALDVEARVARQQRLPRRPRHPDAAGKTEQRHLLAPARTSTGWSKRPSSRSIARARSGLSALPRASSTARNGSLIKRPSRSCASRPRRRWPGTSTRSTTWRRRSASGAFAKGALDLDFPEVKVRVNELGIPTHLEKNENDISHQLIEEFMLLANEVVALELKRRGRPGLYRIHENPDPDRLQEFRAQAKSMGFPCGDLTQRGEIQKLLNRVRGQPGEAWSRSACSSRSSAPCTARSRSAITGFRSMNYTHFTSPIRRYSDLVVHRVLFTSGRGTRRFELRRPVAARAASFHHRTLRLRGRAGIGEAEEARVLRPAGARHQAHVVPGADPGSALLRPCRAIARVRDPGHGSDVGTCKATCSSSTRNGWNCRASARRSPCAPGSPLQVEVARVDLARHQVDFQA